METTNNGQYTTISSTNSGPAFTLVEEGKLNVSLYCEVISKNIQVETRWLVKRSTDAMLLTTEYNTSSELASSVDLVGKITAIGDVILNLIY